MRLIAIIKKHPLLLSSILIVTPILIILTSYYLNRLGAFGCFDDCNNFMRGYFVLKGRTLFSEVFSGHMPMMSYLSTLIQWATSPNSIYQLLLFHTIFLIGVSVVSWIILIFRFRWISLGFIIFYELFKLYLFGDRFLAEGVIVYPLVYMTGLVWLKLNGKEIFKLEYLLVAVATWFVIFMREPYIPLVLFLYLLILWGGKELKIKIISVSIFILLSTAFLLAHPLSDFILNVYTINKINIASEINDTGIKGIGFLKIFFYPVFIFTSGEFNIMRLILIILSSVFFLLLSQIFQAKKLIILIIILILGLANLRYTEPGTIFYSAYHLLIWYGLFVMFVFLMLSEVKSKKIRKLLLAILGVGFLITFINPNNVLWQRVDTDKEIHDGYANYSINGRVIRTLANENSTLFVDGSEDLIYWRADLKPAYKYSWYTSLMPFYKPFVDARLEMFRQYPPDFYYGNCRKGYILPDFIKDEYINLKKNGKKSCLYIKKDQISLVSDNAWKSAKELGFSLE